MRSKLLKNLAFAALVVCFASFSVTESDARDLTNISAQKPTDSVSLSVGKSQVVSVGKNVSDVLVSDPAIVEVGAVKDNQLSLTGSKIGNTNVLVFDDKGGLLRTISIHVAADIGKLSDALNKQLPGENINANAVGDQIFLTGNVKNAENAAKARDLATKFAQPGQTIVNNLKVSGGQQVMIHVKVVEVARNVLNELGIQTDIAGLTSGNFSASHTTGAGAGSSFGLTVDPSFGNGSLMYDTGSTGPIGLIVHALERDGLVNTLAQPNLTAISGENARFLAGGEFPIPSSRDNNGQIVYEYRPFGVSLSFRPVVLDKDRINLQISTEVSEVSTNLTLQLPGITVPSFTVRRAETTVEMASGGSLMIAGLIESQGIERMNQLPGIKDIPVLGALVRSESFSRNESELLVIITAYLVEPFADKQAERIPQAPHVEPLNRALAEALAVAYGSSVNNYANGKPFGYIME